MYQITFDGAIIYDPRDPALVIRNPDCHLAVGEAGSLSFTIDPDHPYAGRLTKIKGVLALHDGGRTIFKGRLRRDKQDFELPDVVEAEGLMACLNDSIIPPFNFPEDFIEDAAYIAAAESGNVVRFFLEWALAQHNNQVGPAQQIQLGDVTVADPNNYISRSSSEYMNTLEVIRKKLPDLLGGYLLADYSGETTVLHYYKELPLTNVQEVEYGENLLDLVTETDATETYTAILPVGADGLTLESLDDGEISPGYFKEGKIIYSKAAEDAYEGRITHMEKWDDVTLVENLRDKALTRLSTDGVKLVKTISIQAIDLGGVPGGDVPCFVVGRQVRLNSTPHGFSATYPLTELDPDIMNPGNTRITLGETIKTASDRAHASQSATDEKLQQHQLDLDQQHSSLVEVEQETHKKIIEAVANSESYLLGAMEEYTKKTAFESYQQTVSSQFEGTAEEIRMQFEASTDYTDEVNGDLQRTKETLEKHFDFSLDGLVIHAGSNEMEIVIDNDLILFRKNGQQFGWWDGVDFHTGNIVVKVNERAQFGDFAFVPRSNRSLSFLKVGG